MARQADCPVVGKLLERAALYSTAATGTETVLAELLKNGGKYVVKSTSQTDALATFQTTVTDAATAVCAKDPSSVEIVIAGELLAVPSALLNLGDEVEHVHFVIDSCGGSSFAAKNIAVAVGARRSSGHVDGICMSAAVDLLQRCQHRTATRDSIFMVHSTTVYLVGGLAELDSAREQLEQIESDGFELLLARTGQPAEVVAAWLDGRNHYFSAEQAREHGLIDEIV